METITIVGMQNVNFTDQGTGQVISGTSFFYTQENDHVVGLAAGKMFISNEKADRLSYLPEVGDQVRVFYNRYGKPENFELVSAK